MNTKTRTPWVSGLAIAMIFLTSGCLEGEYKNGGYPDSTAYYSPGGSIKMGYDLLNKNGLNALFYPVGTSASSVATKPADPTLVYRKRFEVSTEQELNDAMTVAAGEAPHWIEIKNSIVVEHDLTLRGDVLITSMYERNMLRVLPGASLHVLANQKPAFDLANLKACSSTRWQSLASGSSIRFDVPLDGMLHIQNDASLHVIVSVQPEVGAGLVVNPTSTGTTLLAVSPSVDRVYFESMAANSWIASGYLTTIYLAAGTSMKDNQQLILKNDDQLQDTSMMSQRNCQNLRSDIFYPMADYDRITTACYDGHWTELASTFATCGGAL